MHRNPGFEPSVWSVLNAVAPEQWTVISGGDQLHRRVSYPLIMRTTGLGRIEGGELVLVPPARAREVLAGVRELCETGISGIVIFGIAADALVSEPIKCSAPVVTIAEGTELQIARERINRYTVRRRRELFTLEQHLHRILVDAAIAGTSLVDLMRRASDETQSVIVLDRGGELLHAPGDADTPSPMELARARRALDRESEGRYSNAGPPRLLSLEVAGGGERRGLVAAFGLQDDRQEEDEAVLSALASAASIALARSPMVATPSLDDVLARRTGTRFSGSFVPDSRWTALALAAGDVLPETVQRVAASQAEGRTAHYIVAESGDVLVVLGTDVGVVAWESFLAALGARTRVPVETAGVGRTYPGLEGAERSAREAIRALQHANGAVTQYADIEVTVLLLSLANGHDFIRARLGPLLDRSPVQRELLDTLKTYLASGKNAKEAARRLAVHRNTLLYRLRRVVDLLALDWDDADAVFALDLALRLLALHDVPLKSSDGSD